MMKLVLSALLLFSAGAALAECNKPAAPELPDGATSDMAAMVEGQKSVKAYVASTEGENGYLSCLTAEGEAAGEEEPPEAKMARVEQYNAAVSEMEAVANQFNEEIRAFKAKSN